MGFGIKDLPQGLIDAVTEVLRNDVKEELCPGCLSSAADCECPKEDCGAPHMKKEDEDKEDGEGKEEKEEKLDEESNFKEGDKVKLGNSKGVIQGSSDKPFTKKLAGEKVYRVAFDNGTAQYASPDSISKLSEAIAIDPADLASSEPRSAIGQRNSEMPKHVDIVKEDDFRPVAAGGTRTEGYRLLLQYSTNTRPQFVPELSLPAAPTLEALSAMIPGSAEVVEAIANALNLPHLRPAYKGNDISEEDIKKKFKKLVENVIDAEGLQTELELMAMNNYPEYWRTKNLNALIAKLVADVKQMGSIELRHEIEDALPEIKKALQAAWREESRGR